MASALERTGTCKALFVLLVLLLSPAAPTATAAVLSARGKFVWAPRDATDVYPSEISRAHANAVAPTPIVVWHGLGDSCCNPDSIGGVVDAIKQHLPGEPPLRASTRGSSRAILAGKKITLVLHLVFSLPPAHLGAAWARVSTSKRF
jgi:hypothetical protein